MIQLIQAATASNTNEDRIAAEKGLIELRQQNPDGFFQQVVEVFASKDAPRPIREAAGTLIAVSVLAKNKTNVPIWDTLSGNVKNSVKNSNLEVLIDPERSVRRSAANVVSAICFVELPRNEWEDIVQKICVNVSHKNQVVKQASILTLGFICSRMKERADFTFAPEVQNTILSGIILGIQQTQPYIIDTALKALRDSISSLEHTLSHEQYRAFVLKQLVDIINTEKYSLDGLQILGEFVQTCYPYVGQYMEGFITLLTPLINNYANEESCIAATEIWQNIAAEYKNNSEVGGTLPNYIVGNHGQLIVTSLLKNLSVMEDEDDSDENPISDSASKALETIFTNGSTPFKALVLQFVKVSISQNDWKHRQASIKAFSLLLYGLADEQIEPLIGSSINELIGLLNDNSKPVQFAALDSLTIITEVSGQFILKSPLFIQYLKLILSKISISEKFLKTGCRVIDNLCEAEKEYNLNKFTDIADDLIGYLLKFVLANQSTLSIINWGTATVMNIIEVTSNQVVIRKYLTFVLENFDNIKAVGDAEKRETLSSAFLTIMQFCLHGLRDTPLEESILVAIYNKVITSFQSKGDVNPDGMYVVSELIFFFNKNVQFINNFWAYISHALQKWQDQHLFRATVCCIASFLNCYGNLMSDRLQTFVPVLMDLMENPSFNKDLKLECLVALGEVFLICPQQSKKYLGKLLQVILLCCSAAVQITETDFAYSEQLKDYIIEALMCIVHGINEIRGDNQFTPFVPNVFQFVMLSCHKKNRPTVNYLKRSILLMADIGKFYPEVVKPIKHEPFVAESINTLKTFNKNKQFDEIIKYAQLHLK